MVLDRQQKAVSAHAQKHGLNGEDQVGWPVLSDWYGAAIHRRLGLNPGRVRFWIDKPSMFRIETAEDVKRNIIGGLSSKSGEVTYDHTHRRGCGSDGIAFVRLDTDIVHLCRPFWKAETGENERALTLVHEWAHLAKGFGDDDSGFGNANAYCVEKFVADLNETDSNKPREAGTSSICQSPL